MQNVYVVPGFMGTDLRTGPFEADELWVSYTRLALGELRGLALATNGVDPLAPHGQECQVGFPLRAYYAMSMFLLHQQLFPVGYLVHHHSWDWRKRIISQGVGLADRIRSEVTAGDPCTIIGHSAGGLVARAAWQSLVATSQTNLVRRIVTLGTPHQGSYAPVALWSLSDETLDIVYLLQNLIPIVVNVGGIFSIIPSMSKAEIAAMSATWPALYEMLPLLGSADSAADPNREYLYTASNWPAGRGVTQAHLDNAQVAFGAFLRSSTSIPPPWVLTTIGGTGVPTPRRLERPSLLGEGLALGITDDGDGLVTDESAIISGSRSYFLYERHVDMPLATAISGDLADWVREIRVAPTPAPPPVEITRPLTPRLGALPTGRSLLPGPTECGSYCC